jgi:hypothetical protein
VQMFVEGLDGGRRFFKCPRAEVIGFKIYYSNLFSIILHLIGETNCMFTKIFKMQCSESKKTVASLGESILDQSIRTHSTSTTCKTVSSN